MEKKLGLPYFSQQDNAINPTATCGPTSIAMCLAHFGVKRKSTKVQLEDEITDFMNRNGLDKGSPLDLAAVVASYGLKDDFTSIGNIAQLKLAIDEEKPCVIHGWFTGPGHIVAVDGYYSEGTAWYDQGLFVHDPWGEYYRRGYDNSVSGKGLRYSNDLIRRLCMDDGYLWLHRISR